MAKSKVPTLDDIVDKIFNGKDLSKMEKQAVQSNVKPYNQKAIEQEIKNRLVKVQTTGSVKDVESILSNFSTHLKNFSSSANVAINNNTFTQELNDVREAMFKNALAEKTVGDWTELARKETKSTHLNSSSALPGFEEKWAEKLRQVESPEVLDAVLNHSADKDQILSGLEEAQRKGKTTGIDFGDNVNKKLMQNRIEKLKKNPTLLTSNTDITEWRALREAAKVSNDTNLTKLASEVPNNTILTSLDETLDKEVIEELADRQDFAQTSKKLSKGAKDVFDKKIASGAGIADEAKLNYALDNNLLTDDQINKLGNEDLSKMQDQSLKNKLQTRVDAYDDQILKTKGFDPETNPRLKKRFETPSAQGGFTANQRADYINNAKEGTFYESTTGKFTEAGEKLTQQEKVCLCRSCRK